MVRKKKNNYTSTYTRIHFDLSEITLATRPEFTSRQFARRIATRLCRSINRRNVIRRGVFLKCPSFTLARALEHPSFFSSCLRLSFPRPIALTFLSPHSVVPAKRNYRVRTSLLRYGARRWLRPYTAGQKQRGLAICKANVNFFAR